MAEIQNAKPEDENKEQPLMDIKEIRRSALLDEVTKLHFDNWRLIQICATKTGDDMYEVLYTFGRGYEWTNLRITAARENKISSITSVYEVAYLYENEIHDLFGLEIDMMNYDFRGKLFRTGVPHPFA